MVPGTIGLIHLFLWNFDSDNNMHFSLLTLQTQILLVPRGVFYQIKVDSVILMAFVSIIPKSPLVYVEDNNGF